MIGLYCSKIKIFQGELKLQYLDCSSISGQFWINREVSPYVTHGISSSAFYAELNFRTNTFLGRKFLGRSFKGRKGGSDCTVDFELSLVMYCRLTFRGKIQNLKLEFFLENFCLLHYKPTTLNKLELNGVKLNSLGTLTAFCFQ